MRNGVRYRTTDGRRICVWSYRLFTLVSLRQDQLGFLTMSERDLVSSLRRAKIGVEIWLARLPKDMTLDAQMALDCLMQVAEREIDRAYRDGAAHRSSELSARRMVETAASVEPKAP